MTARLHFDGLAGKNQKHQNFSLSKLYAIWEVRIVTELIVKWWLVLSLPTFLVAREVIAGSSPYIQD